MNEFAPLQSLRSGAAGADLSRRLEDGTHALRRAHPARRMASTLDICLRWEVAALTLAVFIGGKSVGLISAVNAVQNPLFTLHR